MSFQATLADAPTPVALLPRTRDNPHWRPALSQHITASTIIHIQICVHIRCTQSWIDVIKNITIPKFHILQNIRSNNIIIPFKFTIVNSYVYILIIVMHYIPNCFARKLQTEGVHCFAVYR